MSQISMSRVTFTKILDSWHILWHWYNTRVSMLFIVTRDIYWYNTRVNMLLLWLVIYTNITRESGSLFHWITTNKTALMILTPKIKIILLELIIYLFRFIWGPFKIILIWILTEHLIMVVDSYQKFALLYNIN